MEHEDQGLVRRIAGLEIDWPRSIGYFGGIGVAVAYELIAPPIAIFIAAIPFLKLLKPPGQPFSLRVLADILEGVAKPVGGDTEATIRLAPDASAAEVPGANGRRSRLGRRRRPGRRRARARRLLRAV